MKSKTKKIFAVLLVAATIAGASIPLAGCGGNDTATTSSAEASSEAVSGSSSESVSSTAATEESSSEVVSSHVHTWTAATCTKPKTCKTCGATEGEALGHKWKAATCTKAKTCTVCGVTSGKALGHDYTAWKTTKKATCTKKGKKTRSCETCGKTWTKSIAKTKHTAGDWEETGTEGDYTVLTKSCTVCGKVLKTKKEKQEGGSVSGMVPIQGGNSSYNSPKITLAEYNQIQIGMSYSEVVNIIGGDGTQLSYVELYGQTAAVYVWYGSGTGDNATIEFSNGAVCAKAQYGL